MPVDEKALVIKIELLRRELNKLVQEKGVDSKEALLLSKELDLMIVTFLKSRKKNKIRLYKADFFIYS